jgi:hypothetical protein
MHAFVAAQIGAVLVIAWVAGGQRLFIAALVVWLGSVA